MNIKYQRNTPPPRAYSADGRARLGGGVLMKFIIPSPVKSVLFLLFSVCFLAVPVQSQSTATPTPDPTSTPFPNAKLVNPSTAPWVDDCGLPLRWSEFDSSATHRTFNMTRDCVFTSYPSGQEALPMLHFVYLGGTFTINGNGHSIIGPPNRTLFVVGGAHPTLGNHPVEAPTVILNLNNVTIRQTGGESSRVPVIVRGARLNATNVIFRDNQGQTTLSVWDKGKAYLTNVQFLNNRKTHGEAWRGCAISAHDGAATQSTLSSTLVSINGGVFRRNSGCFIVVGGYQFTLELAGNIAFEDNTETTIREAVEARHNHGIFNILGLAGVTTNTANITSAFNLVPWRPPKKEEATPAPTSTPRPQIAATHVALQAETGATFSTTFGLDSGVHFRQLDGAGIGVQSIIDAGFLEAFDVYGYVEQGVEVCFPQIGRVVFLDANTSPRAIVPLESTIVNGQTCVSINSPGSLVLLPN